MYDTGKIVPGLVILGILLTSPLWYSAASGKISYVPQPELPTAEKQCVEPAQWMRDNHMKLLDQWRTMVVRDGVDTYVASDGRQYTISLTNTCLKCHSKQKFCDQCHSYVDVTPTCWDCHNAPEGGQ